MINPKRIEHMLKFMNTDNLSDWEEKFYASIEQQFKTKGTLTELQYEKLEDIFIRNQ